MILILGRRGWLAQAFAAALPDASVSMVDVTDGDALEAEIRAKQPTVVINAAGITGKPNIDWCETHSTPMVFSNVVGAALVRDVCQQFGIYLVHLGSGCIFQGDNDGRGWSETDAPNPPSLYSWGKAFADQLVTRYDQALVLRLRMPVSSDVHDRNLITKLSRYRSVIHAMNSVTIVPDFIAAAKLLISRRRTGVYHVVNPGAISPADIAALYTVFVDEAHQFEVIPPDDLYVRGLAAAGRSNCLLNTDKLTAEGIHLPQVEGRVVDMLREMRRRMREAA